MTTNQTPQPFEELKRDMVNELSNAYYEVYRYERPNDTYEQLGAFCRDLASNAVDELLLAQKVAHRAEQAALIERINNEVIPLNVEQLSRVGEKTDHHNTHLPTYIEIIREQRTALDKLKAEYEGEK